MNRIRQILINVISNSFKFTNQGGITLSVRQFSQRVRCADTKCIEFVVSDTGIGISDEEKQGIVCLKIASNAAVGIFKLFNAAKHQRDVFNMKGIGLGLTITKKLVHSLCGKIILNSEEEKGTNISIIIIPCSHALSDENLSIEEFD